MEALYDTLRQRDLVQKVELRAMSEAGSGPFGAGLRGFLVLSAVLLAFWEFFGFGFTKGLLAWIFCIICVFLSKSWFERDSTMD